jgi:hypothetical protein
LRRSTKLVIALLTLGVVLTPVAVIVFFTEGSIVSSPSRRPAVTKVWWIPLRPKPPSAVALRTFLRADGQHPTSCTARGSRMVCLLAHGAGRCEESSDGDGSCTFEARTKSVAEEMIWATNNFSDTVAVTSSAAFR